LLFRQHCTAPFALFHGSSKAAVFFLFATVRELLQGSALLSTLIARATQAEVRGHAFGFIRPDKTQKTGHRPVFSTCVLAAQARGKVTPRWP
jgi:hypothetical protein